MSWWGHTYLPELWARQPDRVPERIRLDTEEIERRLEDTVGKKADKRTVRREARKAETDNMENER